jgi:HAE1 family hydrophobic/amphiphilic exporter-1
MSELFIRRPVMTTLVMAAMVIFGILGYVRMPVSELPAVEFPTISVSASLAGADPETMASSVATPLENEFSSIAGIESMSSRSTLGSTRITLQFSLDRDIDGAAQDVQAAISSSLRDLPDEMTSPPSFRKSNPAESSILYLAMSSPTARLSDINQYAEGQLARRLSIVEGVAEVNVYGSQKYAVRLQLDPNALAARGLAIGDVAQAAREANVNQPSGSLSGPTRDATIHTSGQLKDAESFARQIVTYRNGAPVRLGDLGQMVDSVENTKVASWFNGTRAIILAIKRQPGSNTIAVVDRIREVLPSFEAQLPPTMQLDVLYDRSQTIRASVHEVQFTLILAACLVVLVIFLFLRTLSATLIPSLALPIAVIGTFAGMAVMGYSIDNLSLMALTLSVGFVVDDAIVVLENIVRHIEKGEKPYHAAIIGAREVSFTIVSMTVSLAAVFIPVLFMGGIIGRLLNEFAVTIVMAILVSGVISVTLTPMLCSRLIRASKVSHDQAPTRGLLGAFERMFDRTQSLYARSLRWSMTHHRITFSTFLASIVLAAGLAQVIPKDFLPTEDSGRIIAFTQGTAGGSLQEMAVRQQAVAEIIAKHPAVDTMMSSVGAGGPRATASSGTIFIGLKPFSDRNKSAFDVVQELRPQLAQIAGIKVYLNVPPSIRIGGSVSKAEYQYTLQDLDLQTLYASAIRLTEALSSEPLFTDVANNLDLSSPAVHVEIDRGRAAALGVTPAQIESALGLAFGGQQVSTLYQASDQYQVIMELLPEFQRDAVALSRLYLRANGGAGALVPLTAVTQVTDSSLPETVNHLGQLPAVTVSFNLPAGVSLSQAVERLRQVEAEIGMPASTQSTFEGTAQAYESALGGMGWLLALAVLVVYIVLGILYESFIHPLTILSGLPSAAVGALLVLVLFEMPLNLYGFVGVIMLVGIVKKNAIMMIDFALAEQRKDAVAPADAIYQAACVRFRPIMMTTMAALMGTLPIAVGYGAGGEARQPLGLSVVGGLLVSQVLTLYITPVLYVYLDRLGHWIGSALSGPKAADQNS